MKRFISWLKCSFGAHNWHYLKGLHPAARICNKCHRVEEFDPGRFLDGEPGQWIKVED
jgi:hypothetical protein